MPYLPIPTWIHPLLAGLALFSIVASGLAIAAPQLAPTTPSPVVLTSSEQPLQLNTWMEALPAENAPTDPAEVISRPQLGWEFGAARRAATGLSGGAYWFRVALHNPEQHALAYTVRVNAAALNDIDLYRAQSDASGQPIASSLSVIYQGQGANAALTHRLAAHPHLLTSLQLNPKETVWLLWRVDSRPLFRFQAELWSEAPFIAHDRQRSLLFGMLYGALAVMAVYHLFIAASVRERSYFYYVAYLVVTGLLLAAEEGHLAYYLWPHYSWPRLQFYTLCSALSILFFFLFTANILHLRQEHRPSHQLLQSLTALTMVLILAGNSLDNSWVMRAALGSATLLYVAALAVAVRLRLAGITAAGHYVLAVLSLLAGLIANNLANLGLLPLRWGLQEYTVTGTAAMLVLFSLALADRINHLRRELLTTSSGIARADEDVQRAHTALEQIREERRHLELRIAQTDEESRAKSNYLAAISHQVRTPMNSLLGMTELLKESTLDNHQRNYLHTIERSGQVLVEIIRELVEFADIESGNLQLILDPFDPEDVVDDCLTILSLAAMEKQINLIAEIDPALPRHLRGDARKLHQVLLSLMGNAIKFTEHGDVVVRVRRSDRQAVNSVELYFEVIDSGVGIDPSALPHLFTPFTALQDHAREVRGTGLGLPISKQLIELMDGQIGVDSKPGEGSRFWFTIRCLLSNSTEEPREQPFPGRRILLVEAHPLLSASLERTLSGWGASVTTVTDAHAAEQSLGYSMERALPFDAALIDYQLPSGSGLTLAREITHSDVATPPLILITAFGTALDEDQLSAAGIEILLEKPITQRQLLNVLDQALGQAQHRAHSLAEHPPLQGMRVLIAEDNHVNQVVVSALLRKLGAHPIVVEDGLKAVQAAFDQRPDAILMDCDMPSLDGYQASRRIRDREQAEQRPPIPIIALSAHVSQKHQERAHAAGIDHYLTKPLIMQALERTLRRVYNDSLTMRRKADPPPPEAPS